MPAAGGRHEPEGEREGDAAETRSSARPRVAVFIDRSIRCASIRRFGPRYPPDRQRVAASRRMPHRRPPGGRRFDRVGFDARGRRGGFRAGRRRGRLRRGGRRLRTSTSPRATTTTIVTRTAPPTMRRFGPPPEAMSAKSPNRVALASNMPGCPACSVSIGCQAPSTRRAIEASRDAAGRPQDDGHDVVGDDARPRLVGDREAVDVAREAAIGRLDGRRNRRDRDGDRGRGRSEGQRALRRDELGLWRVLGRRGHDLRADARR